MTPSPQSWTTTVREIGGDREVHLTVIDEAALVVAVETRLPPGVDVGSDEASFGLPMVAEVPGDDRSLAVAFDLFDCQTAPRLLVDRIEGETLVTLQPGGPRNCDAVGGRYAVVLEMAEAVPANAAVTREVSHVEDSPLDAVVWGPRLQAPGAGQQRITVVDWTLLSMEVQAEEPPVISPGPTGIVAANAPNESMTVSVAWTAPCGTESTLFIEPDGDQILFRVELFEVNPCPGGEVYQLSIRFTRSVPIDQVVTALVVKPTVN